PPDSAKDFWPWEKALWLTIDSARVDSLVADMVSAHVWLEPTLTMEYHFGRAIDPPIETPYLRRPPSLRAVLFMRGSTNVAVAPSYPDTWRRQSAFVGDFVKRGGMVVAGSDGKAPGIDLHEEMWLIGDVTGSRMKGLQAATGNAAIALNRTDVGTIERGKLADAVVYSTDPLSQHWASLRITQVLKGGVVHQASDLRMEFEAEYAAAARAVWRGRMIRLLPFLGAGLLSAVAIVTLWRRRRRVRGSVSL
ncbi:MAG: amidohydrolase family protein, partial [Gemmatimonas sp.]